VPRRQSGIGILDTRMCQRGDPEASDVGKPPQHGMALPRVKHCVAVDRV